MDPRGISAWFNPLLRGQGQDRLLEPGAVLFCDFDGPIVDVSERYYRTYRLSLEQVQSRAANTGATLITKPLTKAEFWAMKCDRTPDLAIATASGLTGADIQYFLDAVQVLVNGQALLNQDTMQPGVRWALSQLCRYGVQLMIVSLRQQSQVQQILQNWGLDTVFSHVYGASDAAAAYQNQAEQKTALLKAAIATATQQGWQPGWMIGDTEADILAAQSAQIPVVAITSGIRSQTYLEQYAPTLTSRSLRTAIQSLLDIHPPLLSVLPSPRRWPCELSC